VVCGSVMVIESSGALLGSRTGVMLPISVTTVCTARLHDG
jgi:hypothetical protein